MTMPAPSEGEPVWIDVDDPTTAGGVRRAGVGLATEAGLSPKTVGNLAIVATELATNLARHADRGTVMMRVRRGSDRLGFEIIAADFGPGMPDLIDSIRDGVSTAGTLGIGLGAVARMADELHAYSRPGSGTIIAATLWDGSAPPPAWVAGALRPIAGETVCGDGYAVRVDGGRRQIMLCDGLGHGPIAARAAGAAVAEFVAAPPGDPATVLARLHDRTRHTRGSVVAVAELDVAGGVVRYAGIGNVSSTVLSGGQRRAMVSLPGIVGQQRRDIREFSYPVAAGDLLIMHSDGVTDRWDLASYPGLVAQAPVLIAATLLRDHAKRRDDASVVVARA
jgi:anti-sigma regulatory factor (Ser/Thr protein kinase)